MATYITTRVPFPNFNLAGPTFHHRSLPQECQASSSSLTRVTNLPASSLTQTSVAQTPAGSGGKSASCPRRAAKARLKQEALGSSAGLGLLHRPPQARRATVPAAAAAARIITVGPRHRQCLEEGERNRQEGWRVSGDSRLKHDAVGRTHVVGFQLPAPRPSLATSSASLPQQKKC